MSKLFVLVYQHLLELLQDVDQNALLALNVLKTGPALIKNASIHVLELVVQIQSVM